MNFFLLHINSINGIQLSLFFPISVKIKRGNRDNDGVYLCYFKNLWLKIQHALPCMKFKHFIYSRQPAELLSARFFIFRHLMCVDTVFLGSDFDAFLYTPYYIHCIIKLSNCWSQIKGWSILGWQIRPLCLLSY